MEEQLIKKRTTSIHCGVCRQSFAVGNINTLGYQEDLWFLKAFCSAYHAQYLVAAVIKEGRIPEVITDFTEAERVKFGNLKAVTPDDILDMHRFLKGFEGDCSRLLDLK